MKVIFLDHDGVTCLSTEWGSRFKNKEGLDSTFDRFNDKAIKVLNKIIEETDCEIVISSDWRFHATLEQMQELYKRLETNDKAPVVGSAYKYAMSAIQKPPSGGRTRINKKQKINRKSRKNPKRRLR